MDENQGVAKTATVIYEGPPDQLVVALGRVVQPGEEIELEEPLASALANNAGFSVKGRKKAADKPVEPHDESKVGE